MPNTLTIWNKVDRSGDVMTGDLNLGLNALILNDGINGGIIRGAPTHPDKIYFKNAADDDWAKFYFGGGDMYGDLNCFAESLVDGIDVSEIHQAKVKTGTYVGNGVDNRNIDIGVDLASKSNAYVIVKGASADYARHRIEYGQGDLTMQFFNNTDSADMIQALTSTGFQVGADSSVNGDTVIYRYIVFWQE